MGIAVIAEQPADRCHAGVVTGNVIGDPGAPKAELVARSIIRRAMVYYRGCVGGAGRIDGVDAIEIYAAKRFRRTSALPSELSSIVNLLSRLARPTRS